MSALEWVETTAKTVEEAKDAALDELGVAEDDAEFEVLEQPRPGLFGRLRGEARIRARVRPVAPRPKLERRDRRRSGKGRKGKGPGQAPTTPPPSGDGPAERPASPAPEQTDRRPGTDEAQPERSRRSRRQGRGARQPAHRDGDRPDTDDRTDQESTQMTETELAAQGEVVKEFLIELLDAFEADGTVTVTVPDDENVDIAVEGEDLGLLIGPKGQTLQAIQELSRSVVQRRMPGEAHGRIRVDVSGYRQRRKEALERFAHQVADQVKESGTRTALEPMSPPDRKIVHDVVNEIDGVTTVSEGEDARRRVVILPE
jgi:spoIIIJ-associated protein